MKSLIEHAKSVLDWHTIHKNKAGEAVLEMLRAEYHSAKFRRLTTPVERRSLGMSPRFGPVYLDIYEGGMFDTNKTSVVDALGAALELLGDLPNTHDLMNVCEANDATKREKDAQKLRDMDTELMRLKLKNQLLQQQLNGIKGGYPNCTKYVWNVDGRGLVAHRTIIGEHRIETYCGAEITAPVFQGELSNARRDECKHCIAAEERERKQARESR